MQERGVCERGVDRGERMRKGAGELPPAPGGGRQVSTQHWDCHCIDWNEQNGIITPLGWSSSPSLS